MMRHKQSSARHCRVHPGISAMAFAAVATTVLIAASVAANAACPSPLNLMGAVMQVQADIFAALENEDRQAWERLTTRDFVAFEGGRRHGRTAVFNMVKYAHGTGRQFTWSVTSPRLEADCTIATLAPFLWSRCPTAPPTTSDRPPSSRRCTRTRRLQLRMRADRPSPAAPR